MTERQALLGAGAAHILLFAALSIGWQWSQKPLDVADEMIPVEFVDIADVARVVEAPKPSMEAAPQETSAPEPVEATPEPAPPVPTEAISMPEAKPEPAKKAADKPAVEKKPLDMSSLSNLIDKALPKAKVKPLDTSKLATSIEAATPKSATIDPRTAATLREAIRAQIFLCWNPPIGGADVRSMTVMMRGRYAKDGSIIGLPTIVEQTGVTTGNADYARAFADTAKRAMLRCSPLKLPANLYNDWKEVDVNFDPKSLT